MISRDFELQLDKPPILYHKQPNIFGLLGGMLLVILTSAILICFVWLSVTAINESIFLATIYFLFSLVSIGICYLCLEIFTSVKIELVGNVITYTVRLFGFAIKEISGKIIPSTDLQVSRKDTVLPRSFKKHTSFELSLIVDGDSRKAIPLIKKSGVEIDEYLLTLNAERKRIASILGITISY